MEFDLWYLVAVVAVILLSMTLHEAMHAFTSYWLGDDTAKAEGRLTLNPLRHIDPFLTILLPVMLVITSMLTGGATPIFGGAKPVPFNPMRVRYGDFGAALVGIAGPLTNLLIAFLSFGLFVLVGMPSGETIPGLILLLMVQVNLGFFIFNMLPIPPLDGSRVLYAFAPDGVRRFMEMVEQYGIFVVFAIVLLAGSALGTFMVAAMRFFIGIFAWIFGVNVIA